MGVFEFSSFAEGTRALGHAVSSNDGFTIVGGGDTVAVVEELGIADSMSYISTGGGARIGANAVITKDVEENSVMVGIPARSVGIADSEFKPYGITPDSDKKSDNE